MLMLRPNKRIDWNAVPLGQLPDTALARELGVAPQVVWTARTRRAIPPHSTAQARRAQDVDWEHVGLGKRPDRVIAVELSIDRRRVCYERSKRRIPAFVGLVLTQEGEACRSVYEAMWDAVLHDLHIPHEHEVPVPGLPFIADFRVANVFHEVAGMTDFPRYRVKHERKREAYERAFVQVRWLSADEVAAAYRVCSVPLCFRSARRCRDCGKQTSDLVKQVCRRCYMRRWHRSVSASQTCAHCGVPIHVRDARRFCSRGCYWKSLELEWPSWEEIDQRLAEKPIRQVAIDLGVKPNALYMRLRRRRERVAARAIRIAA
jgi:hypothetical protein